MEYVIFRDNMQFTDPHFLAQCSLDSFRSVPFELYNPDRPLVLKIPYELRHPHSKGVK